MLPFETLESTRTADGHELTLRRHDRDFYIYIDGQELMSSRMYSSESALAELGCAHLARTSRCRVLIGGLGLGFTLGAALEVLPASAEVVVGELFPALVDWHHKHLGDLGAPLRDRRVSVRCRDVVDLLSAEQPYDAILLDVDNGPSAWCVDSNRRLYSPIGIERLKKSLQPRGMLAVWSTDDDAAFVSRLGKAGFAVRCERVRARSGKGGHHFIFLAMAPPAKRRRG